MVLERPQHTVVSSTDAGMAASQVFRQIIAPKTSSTRHSIAYQCEQGVPRYSRSADRILLVNRCMSQQGFDHTLMLTCRSL